MAPLTVEAIDQFIGQGNPLAQAGGAQTLLRATGGNLAGAAFLAALARKESEFGKTAGKYRNNFWGWGVHLGPEVHTSPSVEAGAAKVWKGLTSGLYKGAGLVTPGAIINRYAPPSENNTDLYKTQVGQWFTQLGLSPQTNIFSGSTVPVPAAGAGARPAGGRAPAAEGFTPQGQVTLTPKTQKAIKNYIVRSERDALAGRTPGDISGLVGMIEQDRARSAPRAAAATPATVARQSTPSQYRAAPGSFRGLSMGGGPEGHGTRALGNWQSDNAYDLMGKAGDPIPAFVSGTVTKISGQPGGDPGFAGYGITIRTSNGVELFYKHLGTSNVRVGQRITPQTILGTLDPGTAGGPHLHLGGTHRGFLDQLAKRYVR